MMPTRFAPWPLPTPCRRLPGYGAEPPNCGPETFSIVPQLNPADSPPDAPQNQANPAPLRRCCTWPCFMPGIRARAMATMFTASSRRPTAGGWARKSPKRKPAAIVSATMICALPSISPNSPPQFAIRSKIEVTPNPTLPVCLLRLSEDFHVTGMKASGAATAFAQAGGVIALCASTTAPGNAFTVEMAYEGRVNHQGSDYILPNEATLDFVLVSAYRPPARKKHGNCHCAARLDGYRAGRKDTGATATRTARPTVTYRNEIPNSFFTLDVGRYTITRRTVNGRVLSALAAHARRGARPSQPGPAGRVAGPTSTRTLRLSPTPITRSWKRRGPFGGALEAYSFATFQSGTLPGTVTHELAHTWWGGLVPCAYTRSMWNKSFAEYSSGLFGRMNRQAGALDGSGKRSPHAASVPISARRSMPLRWKKPRTRATGGSPQWVTAKAVW